MSQQEFQTEVILNLPPGFSPSAIKEAAPMLDRVLNELHRCPKPDEAMRGYVYGAKMDGFPAAQGQDLSSLGFRPLTELCIGAFWWIFETLAWQEYEKRRGTVH